MALTEGRRQIKGGRRGEGSAVIYFLTVFTAFAEPRWRAWKQTNGVHHPGRPCGDCGAPSVAAATCSDSPARLRGEGGSVPRPSVPGPPRDAASSEKRRDRACAPIPSPPPPLLELLTLSSMVGIHGETATSVSAVCSPSVMRWQER